MPLRAQHLVEAFATSEGVRIIDVMSKPSGFVAKRRRYRLWAALYAEETADGRAWTLRQIGEWFGVAHGHVSVGIASAASSEAVA